MNFQKEISRLKSIANSTLLLGTVKRSTHDPGNNQETVTTHTVMLGLVACHLAAELNLDTKLGLSIGKIAELSLVHDIGESISGDIITLRLSDETLSLKSEMSISADKEVSSQLKSLWISDTLQEYNSRRTLESKFVWAIDKILPKLCHILNHCTDLISLGMTVEEFRQRIAIDQLEKIMQTLTYQQGGSDYCITQIVDLHDALSDIIMEEMSK